MSTSAHDIRTRPIHNAEPARAPLAGKGIPAPRKILLISLAGIGDTLFATPLAHELRLRFPEARLEALVMWPGARDILEGNPYLDEVHQKNLLRVGVWAGVRFLWKLRRRRFDVSLNSIPQSRVDYRLVARFIGAPHRLSHQYSHFPWLNRILMTQRLPQDYSIHCVENNLALLRLLGTNASLNQHRYELFLTEAEQRWADAYVVQHQLNRFRLLGIHVGSGGTKNLALRRWPLDRYVELIQKLNRDHPECAVLLFGGPEEEKDHERLLSQVDRARVYSPETRNLRQAAALLGKCQLFLSVDTALMHVAAAMQVPQQVVIETPTWNKTVEPYGRPFRLVPNPAVAGRNLDYYRYDGRGIQATRDKIIACMRSVTVESVYAALLENRMPNSSGF